MKNYNIDLDLGLTPVTIRFKGIEKEVEIAFNPTDPDLPTRLKKAQKNIEEAVKNTKDFEVDENGEISNEAYTEQAEALKKVIFDNIDYAFGNNICDGVFKFCSPFMIVNGDIFAIQFFEKITPVIEMIIREEKKNLDENVNKHLKKYKK